MKKGYVMFAVLVALCGRVYADEIIFKDGEKLDGKITLLDAGKMSITTPVAGDVKADVTKISTFSTDGPITLQLSDGTTISRQIIADGNGQVQIGGMLGNSHINVADIAAINKPPSQWTGDIKFGGLIVRGNTQAETINFGLDVDRKTDADDLSFAASYLYGRTHDHTTGVTTTVSDNWQMDLKYQYNFTKKVYGFAEGVVSKDRLAFLDLRFNPSVGLGYKLIDKPNFTFYPEGGVAWVYETYTNGTPTRGDFSLKLAYHLTAKFNDKVSLIHDFSYYPSVERGSDFLVSTDIGVRSTMTTHFFTELKMSLDYDFEPGHRALKTNTRYELNIGYSFASLPG